MVGLTDMNIPKSSSLRFLPLLLLFFCKGFTAPLPVPELTGRVVDLTGTLSFAEKQSLEDTLHSFEDRKGSQVAVLIVPTPAPEEIEQYSIRVVEKWKLGRKKID